MDNKIFFSLIFILIIGTLTNQSFATSASQTKLVSLDLDNFDQFAHSISISDDTLAVGAPDANGLGTNDGAVYIFELSSGTWSQIKKITPNDPAANDFFGTSVSLSDDLLVVGAPGDDDLGSNSGSVYIFQRNEGGNDNWGQFKKLTASAGESNDQFGHSLELSADSADVIIVGSPGTNDIIDNPDPAPDTPVPDSGAAYIFERNEGGNDNWGEKVILRASDAVEFDLFGSAVTIDGNTAVVGTFVKNNFGGQAYVFDKDIVTGMWSEQIILSASDAANFDEFGISLSIVGNTLAVGSHLRDAGLVTNAGGVYIFERDLGGPDAWNERKILTASDAAANDQFGFSVALDGDTLVAGALADDTTSVDTGSAYLFERDSGAPNNWGQTLRLEASDGASFDDFGRSVDLSSTTTVVGAPQNENSGAAYVHGDITVEIDLLNDFHSTLDLIAPDGSSEQIRVNGQLEKHVFFEGESEGDASDNDGNTRDEVQTELVSMSLTGDSSLGVVTLRESSARVSSGVIEEQVNDNPGLLDVDPFAPGNANAFFDVFFEVEIQGLALHNIEPIRISGEIDEKPPQCGDLLRSTPTIPLIAEDGTLSGYALGPTIFNECPPIDEEIQSLMDDIDELVDSGDLNPRTASSGNWLLDAALSEIEEGDTETAKNKLQSFISRITLFMNRGLISEDVGQPLIDAAQAIIDQC